MPCTSRASKVSISHTGIENAVLPSNSTTALNLGCFMSSELKFKSLTSVLKSSSGYAKHSSTNVVNKSKVITRIVLAKPRISSYIG